MAAVLVTQNRLFYNKNDLFVPKIPAPHMVETEGVIKYQLNHTDCQLDQSIDIARIDAWRSIMHRLGVIGQCKKKYAGYGYGNISQRIAGNGEQFLISGTQTGHLETLTRNDYCIIVHADLQANRITSRGPCRPSSEALTHAAVYQQDSAVSDIIHGHCPEIWQQTAVIGLPHSAESIPYGTPEMAEAVQRLLQAGDFRQSGLFTMLGHEDGVLAFAADMAGAARELIDCLALALAIARH